MCETANAHHVRPTRLDPVMPRSGRAIFALKQENPAAGMSSSYAAQGFTMKTRAWHPGALASSNDGVERHGADSSRNRHNIVAPATRAFSSDVRFATGGALPANDDARDATYDA
jgi:hypothetical protein